MHHVVSCVYHGAYNSDYSDSRCSLISDLLHTHPIIENYRQCNKLQDSWQLLTAVTILQYDYGILHLKIAQIIYVTFSGSKSYEI